MNKKKMLKHYRLTEEEYRSIKKRLNRSPSRLELALFSALWSEHCSYKSSATHLKKLFFKSPRVLSAQAENAGVIDLGRGEKAAFKIESHNHPSRIVPYHGAATGVGGILRDVFIMNARPVILANYLCFGDPAYNLTAELVDGVVWGIGGYGNSIGIPTLTGQTEFHPSYNENNIVNALALGFLAPEEKVMSAVAKGPGNLLVYAGARTGRDGIHGASMASESFEEEEGEKTCVQIGDPFYGKLLMESCLEVMKKDLVISAQDMGAAGLISSGFEMIFKGGLGMRLYLDRVPLRDSGMTAEEILLSESQERALLVVQPDKYTALEKVFKKWGLSVFVIGELKKEQNAELFWKKDLLIKIPCRVLKAPRYHRPYRKWKAGHRVKKSAQTKLINLRTATLRTAPLRTAKLRTAPNNKAKKILLSLLEDIRGCSREFIYSQYDQRVGAVTVKDCSFPFGVIRLPSSGRLLALCMGGRPHIMRMDSLQGGQDAVYEPALQLAGRGFTPLALTDGLNFGSPEKEKVMSTFVACVEGMAKASRSLKTPVVSGNVSFYNETKGKAVSPTPAVGMAGLRDCSSDSAPHEFSRRKTVSLSSGVYLFSARQVFFNGLIAELYGKPPAFYGSLKPDMCRDFTHAVLKASLSARPEAIRLVGKFGLAYTLARMVMEDFSAPDLSTEQKKTGSSLEIKTSHNLFEERLYEFIVVLNAKAFSVWKNIFSSFKVEKLGFVCEKPVLSLNDICLPLTQIKRAYQSGWSKAFKNSPAEK